MTLFSGRKAGFALASTAALALAACSSNGSYRVASVGTGVADVPGDTGSGGGGTGGGSGGTGSSPGNGPGTGGGGTGGTGGTGSMPGSGLLVTSGNAVIGVAGTTTNVTANLGIPGSGVVTATVTGVVRSTGQTLVQLGSGNTLILGGAGGKLGDVVSLDLGAGRVIGGPSGSPLIGLNVLARNPSTGRLATVGAASGGNLVSVTVPGVTNGLGGTGGGLLAPVKPVAQGVLGGVTNGSASAGANAGLTGTVGSTVKAVVSPSNGISAGSVTNIVTQPLRGVLGVTGTVKPNPPK